MRILSINTTNQNIFYQKQSSVHKTKNCGTTTSFKGYETMLRDYAKTKFPKAWDAGSAFLDLTIALHKETNPTSQSLYQKFADAKYFEFTSFISEISRPVTRMKSSVRDLLYMSKEQSLSLYKNNEYEFRLINFGKHGFWGNLFESESARNKVSVEFSAPKASLALSMTKKGDYLLNQECDNYWIRTEYDGFSGDLISREDGYCTEPINGAFYP